MRQGPNSRRSRGRGGSNNSNVNGRRQNVPSRHQTFDSNGPDVRIRGNAFQVYEKYLALARDATSAGDRIAAENYFQHAEHYFRIYNLISETAGENPPRENGSGRTDQPPREHGGQRDGQSHRDAAPQAEDQNTANAGREGQGGREAPGGREGQGGGEGRPRREPRHRGPRGNANGHGYQAGNGHDAGADDNQTSEEGAPDRTPLDA